MNFNIFLVKVLALCDILFLIHTLMYTMLRLALQIYVPEQVYYNINLYTVTLDLPYRLIAQTGTIWITLLLAVGSLLGHITFFQGNQHMHSTLCKDCRCSYHPDCHPIQSAALSLLLQSRVDTPQLCPMERLICQARTTICIDIFTILL